MSAFFITQILREEKIKLRVKVLEKVISLAEKCRLVNNFYALIMILSSLENSAIYRLKETWKVYKFTIAFPQGFTDLY